MKILITGGFGSIGVVVIEECLKRGHSVSVFEVRTDRTFRLARKYARKGVKVIFGDIRKYDDISAATANQDAVIHMASILPPASDRLPELCRAVNLGGTENLVKALKQSGGKTGIVFVSSASVMGSTQNRKPPVSPDDKLSPTDNYSVSKAEAEEVIQSSGLDYCILRPAAVLPTVLNLKAVLNMTELLFEIPVNARCEAVVDLDVAIALVAACENLRGSGEICGKKGFIAGGEQNGCRMHTEDFAEAMFHPLFLKTPNPALYSQDPDSYYLDWYDTAEVQSLLDYQQHSIRNWQEILVKKLRPILPAIRIFSRLITKLIEKKSPLYRNNYGKM